MAAVQWCQPGQHTLWHPRSQSDHAASQTTTLRRVRDFGMPLLFCLLVQVMLTRADYCSLQVCALWIHGRYHTACGSCSQLPV